MKHLKLLIGATIIASHSTAQENHFKISTEFRERTEFRNGYRTLNTDSSSAALFNGQRVRLLFDYKKDNITFFSSIQDSRVWGDEEQRKDNGGLQVNQLWLELGLYKGFSIKMGRQELAYDDHRILGNLDWANLSISHDALLLKYIDKNKKIDWHLGAAFNQQSELLSGTAYTLKNYKALGFTWVKKQINKANSISALAVVNGMTSIVPTSKSMKATFTIGPLYHLNRNGWKAVLGGYYQGGKNENNLNVSSFMLNSFVEKQHKKFSVGLGYDYLSGNSDKTKTSDYHCFNTLYATNHKFYGYMDYFLNIPGDTKQRGLRDFYLRIGYYPTKKISTIVDVHSMSFAHYNRLGTKAIENAAATETDLLFDYKINPIIGMQIGYSMLFGTNNLELVKGGKANTYTSWAFVMLKVTPVLFHHKLND